jgi:hypothetical protein
MSAGMLTRQAYWQAIVMSRTARRQITMLDLGVGDHGIPLVWAVPAQGITRSSTILGRR